MAIKLSKGHPDHSTPIEDKHLWLKYVANHYTIFINELQNETHEDNASKHAMTAITSLYAVSERE